MIVYTVCMAVFFIVLLYGKKLWTPFKKNVYIGMIGYFNSSRRDSIKDIAAGDIQ